LLNSNEIKYDYTYKKSNCLRRKMYEKSVEFDMQQISHLAKFKIKNA